MKNIFTAVICTFLIGMFSVDSFSQITDALKIRIARGTYSDETIIRFVVGATNDFDGDYDAWKLFSFNAAVPNIFSKDIVNDELSINAMPPLTLSNTQDVFLKIGTAGTYSITPEETGAFAAGVCIMMKDLVTGQLYDMRTVNTYTVSLPVIAQTAPPRFRVFFSLPASIQTSDATCNNCADGNAAITKNGESNWQYAVVNSAGNTVSAGTALSGTQNINGLASGNYTINITSDFSCAESKSFVISVTPIILPVTLVGFNAAAEGNSVKVLWSTASENNSDYFSVERSKDGKQFEEIGTVNAAGNSSEEKKYNLYDENPYSGTSYYRLRETDRNGSSTYSEVVSVNVQNENSINVYPNPASYYLHITLSNSKEKESVVVIKDVLGRECYSQKVIPASDNETIRINLSAAFSRGIYFVAVSNEQKTVEQKIIIN